MITRENFNKTRYDFSDLIDIMRILRQPDGCPWDREQTHSSIRKDLLEEAYETADAIDRNCDVDICEELGDLLLQVVFHSQIAKDEGAFDINDVTDGVCKKLILRHPHVFGNVTAETPDKVLENWDAIKKVEKHQETYTDTLNSVPTAFPALMRSAKVQKRASRAGFDWESVQYAFPKINEEADELKDAIANGTLADMEEELGDLLFAVVNVSRFLKIDAEYALSKATDKFIKRFSRVEDAVLKSGKNMKDLSLLELDELWDKLKNSEY